MGFVLILFIGWLGVLPFLWFFSFFFGSIQLFQSAFIGALNVYYDIIKAGVSVLKYACPDPIKSVHCFFKICRARYGNRVGRWPSAKNLEYLLAMSGLYRRLKSFKEGLEGFFSP